MKTIDERIDEAKDDLFFARMFDVQRGVVGMSRDGWTNASNRAIARAERRLSDLEAVRRKEAVEVYATVSVGSSVHDDRAAWIAHGERDSSPSDERVLDLVTHRAVDRLTILRGIARLPEVTVDEVEAESEGA